MLKERLGTATVLLVLFLAALFYLSDFQWSLLMLAVIGMGAWEWASLMRLKTPSCHAFIGVTLAIGVFLLWQPTDLSMLEMQQEVGLWLIAAVTLFWVLVAPAWLMTRHQMKSRLLLALVGLLILLPTWLALDGLRRVSPLLLLAVMMTVWIADSAAYFAGKQFGKRKLAPQISPGKTWEGAAGAMLAVALYGIILCYLFKLSAWLVLGLLCLTVLSIVGDLFESLLKRQAGLKDSSNLLPGHGGVLDRIDGLTSTLPLVVFYLYFPLYYAVLTHA